MVGVWCLKKNEKLQGRFSGQKSGSHNTEARMKIFKTFFLVILIIGFFQGNLYSRIESRVCGIVKDSENGQVLKDVNVYLVIYNEDDPEVDENDQTALAKTDKDGYFEINDVCKVHKMVVILPRRLNHYLEKYRLLTLLLHEIHIGHIYSQDKHKDN